MSFTPNLAFDLQSHLGNAGTWDTPLNSNFTALDAILGGVYTKSVTGIGAAATFTSANCYANVIRFTGTLAQTLTVTFTTTVVKPWVFEKTTLDAAGAVLIITNGVGNNIALPSGSCQAYWDGSNMNFMNLGQLAQYSDLATTVVPSWIGSCTVPPFLLCNGSSFSAVTYPLLNAHLGGNTLPDFRGRARFYSDITATNRITPALSGITGTTLFSSGGDQRIILTQAQLPSYNLNLGSVSATITINGGGTAYGGTQLASNIGISAPTYSGPIVTSGTGAITATIGGTLPSGGSGASTPVMPPTCIGGITLLRAM
jgi:hypothetical protein